MSAMRPPRALDPHLRHPREDLHRFINGLNVDYNLGVPILDPGLSPSERKQQETPATRLYIRLEVHFYQGGLEVLQQLKREFDLEARQSCSQWVNKPKGDPDTLPESGSSPLATSHVQRECLQSLFHKVLDRSQPKRTFSRTRSGPPAFSMEKTSSVQPKRAAETNINKSPMKRPRLAGQSTGAGQDPNPAVLPKPDHLFAAPQLASEGYRQHSKGAGGSRPESFEASKRSTTYSTSATSKDPSASIFSKVEIEPSTQGTVEASSQEQRRCFSSQDEFEPTSTLNDVLNESFNDHKASENLHSNGTRLRDETCPATQTTNYSCFPSSAVEALRSSPGPEPQAQDERAVAEIHSDHKFDSCFGQAIWRTLLCLRLPFPFANLPQPHYRIGSNPRRST